MQRAPSYGATIVNTHIGSHRGVGRAAGLARIVGNVQSVLASSPDGVRLVLENSSGGGDMLGSTVEELAQILEGVGAGADRLGFCLDTAHLWGAGYDISTADGARAVVDRFEQLIGLERLALVHLNDSRSELGSRADRHEHVGAGRIGPVGLGAFLRDPRLRGATFIMETPGADEGWDAVTCAAREPWGGAVEAASVRGVVSGRRRRRPRSCGGAGYDISSRWSRTPIVDRVGWQLIGLDRAGARPPERLALELGSRGGLGTSMSARDASVRSGWGRSCGIRDCSGDRSSWRRRAPTRAGTRSTCAARGCCAAARSSCRCCRRRRSGRIGARRGWIAAPLSRRQALSPLSADISVTR